MADDRISIPLAMATTPYDSGHQTSQFRRRGAAQYELMRFVQRCGVIGLIFLLSFLAYQGVSRYLIRSVKVVGISMVPTLQEGGQYLLDLWAFTQRDPARKDIVVIRDPMDHGLSVKRIVAVPGQSIHFKNGEVYVNGIKLSEPYLNPGTHTFTFSQAKEQFITCGADQYYVLGDNRMVSIDSRAYGPVPRGNVLGLLKLNPEEKGIQSVRASE